MKFTVGCVYVVSVELVLSLAVGQCVITVGKVELTEVTVVR